MSKFVINGVEINVSTNSSISVNGSSVFINGKPLDTQYHGIVELKIIDGTVHDVITTCSVTCNDVTGSIDADGSVSTKNVGGAIDAGGSVNCGDVNGNVQAGGSINAGRVSGNVRAGGSIVHR